MRGESSALGSNYRRLWVSSTASNLADGLFQVGVPLVAIRLTRSPVLISGLTVALTVPWLLFALHAGALADRRDRRRLMVGANVARCLVAGALVSAVLLDAGGIWVLYVAALAVGLGETIYDTSAQSILPQIVRRDQLSRANGRLFGAQLTANEFVGPPLSGALVATGAAAAFAVTGSMWLAAAGMLLLVRGSYQVRSAHSTTMRSDIAEGLRYLWRQRVLRTLALMTGAFNFASNAIFAIFVIYAVGPGSAMELTEPGYGLLLATIAAGSLAGSLLAEAVERRAGRTRTLTLTIPVAAAIALAPGITTNPTYIGILFFAGGAAIIVFNVIAVSLRQMITPDRLLGRINSGHRLFGWGTRPLGALAGGILGEILGLRAVFLLMALVMLSLLYGMRYITDQGIERSAGPDT